MWIHWALIKETSIKQAKEELNLKFISNSVAIIMLACSLIIALNLNGKGYQVGFFSVDFKLSEHKIMSNDL